MDATDSSPRRTSSIIRRFSSIERSRLPPRVSVCCASSSVDVSISSPKWTRTPCPSLRTHHRRMRCQGSDGGDRTLTIYSHSRRRLFVHERHGKDVHPPGLECASNLSDGLLGPQNMLKYVLRDMQVDRLVSKSQLLKILTPISSNG